MEILKKIWGQKKKMFLFLIATIAFIVAFFPFGDIGDKVTSLVSEATGNQVYLQFDDMSLTMIPQPAVKMTKVLAETPFVSDVTIDELAIAPSLLSAITQKPAGHATASGLFGGELDVGVGSSGKFKKAKQPIAAEIKFTDFQLKELIKTLQLSVPFSMSGQGRLVASVDVDPSMSENPVADVDLQVNKVDIPSFAIPIAMMPPLPLPGFSLEKLTLKGKLQDGKFTINETQIGSPKDELSAKVSGTIDMKVFPGGNMRAGVYNLGIDLNIKDSAQAKFGSMMSIVDGFLGKYRSSSIAGKRYAFRIQGDPNVPAPPNFSPL